MLKKSKEKISAEQGLATLRIAAGLVLSFSFLTVVALSLCKDSSGDMALWPADGAMVVSLLILRRQISILVVTVCFIINLCANLYYGRLISESIIFSCLNVFVSLLTSFGIRRLCGSAIDLSRSKRLMTFVAVTACSSAIEAAIGSLTCLLFHIPGINFHSWIQWTLCDTIGLVISTPALLLFVKRTYYIELCIAAPFEQWGLFIISMSVAALAFSQGHSSLIFALYPIMLWIAFRAGPVWLLSSVLGIALVASALTTHGLGPLAVLTPSGALLRQDMIQPFIASLFLCALPPNNALGERNRATRRLGRMHASARAAQNELKTALIRQHRSETELKAVNDELTRTTVTLKDRGNAIELLAGMARRMQTVTTEGELGEIIEAFAPRVLPGLPGALYAYNASQNLLDPVAAWGSMAALVEGFATNQCWALRRGQSHTIVVAGTDIVCGHVDRSIGAYHCEPLLAGGKIIGALHLEGVLDQEQRFQLGVMAENIALALFSHRLQRSLQEQTIRDPLTSLFNRRYLEETLASEIARSVRSAQALSVVMCDIDNFKHVNDDFGHDAGDIVLQKVAAEMQKRFRDGDVVCRYGGEEFTIIAPGTTASALFKRVEQVRDAISKLNVQHGNRSLGGLTMSFGIASWTADMDRNGLALVQAADAALYQAKRNGRNRTIVGQTLEAA